ncbi:hypothetical protein MMC06_006622 [Schaereria dolodes]|nr:hypothetical protein [Schaereria dolodes]
MSQRPRPNFNRGFRHLEIHLKDSTSAKWSIDGKPQGSVASNQEKSKPPRDDVIDRPNDEAGIVDPDSSPKCSNGQGTVYLPDDAGCEADRFGRNIKIALIREKFFGAYFNADDPWDDKSVREDQGDIFMDLDLELDVLPGTTANMMRLERFSPWCNDGLGSESKYERKLERILKTQSTNSFTFHIWSHIK